LIPIGEKDGSRGLSISGTASTKVDISKGIGILNLRQYPEINTGPSRAVDTSDSIKKLPGAVVLGDRPPHSGKLFQRESPEVSRTEIKLLDRSGIHPASASMAQLSCLNSQAMTPVLAGREAISVFEVLERVAVTSKVREVRLRRRLPF